MLALERGCSILAAATARDEMPFRHLHTPAVEIDIAAPTVPLGEGQFGRVVLVQSAKTKARGRVRRVAMKSAVSAAATAALRTEIDALRIVDATENRPPFIVAMLGHAGDRHLYLEHCDQGDLAALLDGRLRRTLDEGTAMRYASELAQALDHLHRAGIAHRDVKPENVFLRRGHVRLGDFGLARIWRRSIWCRHTDAPHASSLRTTSCVGTKAYLSPEVFDIFERLQSGGSSQEEGGDYGVAVDWWALGMVLYEMLSGRPPWHANDEDALLQNLRTRPPLAYDRVASHDARALIGGLLELDPDQRAGIEAVVEATRIH